MHTLDKLQVITCQVCGHLIVTKNYASSKKKCFQNIERQSIVEKKFIYHLRPQHPKQHKDVSSVVILLLKLKFQVLVFWVNGNIKFGFL